MRAGARKNTPWSGFKFNIHYVSCSSMGRRWGYGFKFEEKHIVHLYLLLIESLYLHFVVHKCKKNILAHMVLFINLTIWIKGFQYIYLLSRCAFIFVFLIARRKDLGRCDGISFFFLISFTLRIKKKLILKSKLI